MITVIEGGQNCGKSEYAELLFGRNHNKGYYVATMIPYGKQGIDRVNKHLKQRSHLNLITVEDPYLERCDEIEAGATVILEDISNLVANYLFERHESIDEIKASIDDLILRCSYVYIVGMKNLSKDDMDDETVKYINVMDSIMDYVEGLADVVIYMDDGIASYIKGN